MNIVDYIKEYGNKSLDKEKFNSVDSLILSQLSYLKYEGIVPNIDKKSEGLTLAEISLNDEVDALFLDRRYESNNRELLFAAAQSRRFGLMKFRDYVNIVDDDWKIQFSAITAQFPNGTTYVVFRGTDDNLVGWQEDLDMIYKTPIPAQEKALEYLLFQAKKIKGNFMVGGHSKGGNLAVYSAMNIQTKIQNRIDRIYSHDGPGFKPEVIENSDFENIQDKIIKLVPKSSIVGMLMTTKEPYEVVLCHKVGMLQHDPFNWKVDGTDFLKADSVDKSYILHDRAINIWALNLTDEQAEYLSIQLFDIFERSGITNLNDLQSNPSGFVNSLRNLAQTMNGVDDDTKAKLDEILKNLGEILIDVIREDFKENINSTLENAKSVVDNVIDNIRSGMNNTTLFNRKNSTDD